MTIEDRSELDIAVLASGSIPSERAHSIAVMKNSQGFRKLGHDVDILTVESLHETLNKFRIDDIHNYYDISSEISVEYFYDNPVYYFVEHPILGVPSQIAEKVTKGESRWVFDPERRISTYCSNECYDVCYCRSYRSAYYNIRSGIPTVVESHTPSTKHPHLQRLLSLSDRSAFRGIVTISDNLKENFRDAGVPEHKILVLQDGVNIERFKDTPNKLECREALDLPRESQLVTYVGSLYPEKGIGDILKVANQIPWATFLLVGGPSEERSRWKKMAAEMELDNIRFEGFVPMREVPLYLTASDVLFMPYDMSIEFDQMSIDDTSPLKLFEYMAAQRPIVSSSIPAIERTIEHGVNGFLAPPNDIDQLREYVITALRDEDVAAALAESAREEVEEYRWSSRCDSILNQLVY